MKPIAEVAASLGLADEDVIPYGRYKAKINHRLIHKATKQGKMILVTAISPTRFQKLRGIGHRGDLFTGLRKGDPRIRKRLYLLIGIFPLREDTLIPTAPRQRRQRQQAQHQRNTSLSHDILSLFRVFTIIAHGVRHGKQKAPPSAVLFCAYYGW